jgi:hypothetical protein
MALINARLDAQTATAAPAAAAVVADPLSHNAITMRTTNPRAMSCP